MKFKYIDSKVEIKAASFILSSMLKLAFLIDKIAYEMLCFVSDSFLQKLL
jgi:hypothetical protein